MIGAIDLSDSQTTKVAKARRQKKNTVRKITARIVMVAIGAIIMALGLELFLVPNHIMDGGIVGVSIIT
ncbi:YitT family protein, partial [Bacillus sp. SIMBA_005]|uniref:YitT family protein n=1 Tax=Bacillus sp. SIMBA_005 TaxID=3085754 RepID=UPI00397A7051